MFEKLNIILIIIKSNHYIRFYNTKITTHKIMFCHTYLKHFHWTYITNLSDNLFVFFQSQHLLEADAGQQKYF